MSAKLATEIRQNKPFRTPGEEALLNLIRTHEFLMQRQAEFFKPFQLTPTQYNILRILRGAGPDGLTCSEAADRMVAADPDITRLLDRLEARELIHRERSSKDRRVVLSRITPQGLELLSAIDAPLGDLIERLVGRVGKAKLEQFVDVLESIREA